MGEVPQVPAQHHSFSKLLRGPPGSERCRRTCVSEMGGGGDAVHRRHLPAALCAVEGGLVSLHRCLLVSVLVLWLLPAVVGARLEWPFP